MRLETDRTSDVPDPTPKARRRPVAVEPLHPLSPSAVLALQRTAGNLAVGRRLAAARPRLTSDRAAIQRVIEGGRRDYAKRNQRVKVNGKLGTIVGIQGKTAYRVQLDGSRHPERFSVDQLDLVDEPAPQQQSRDSSKETASPTSSAQGEQELFSPHTLLVEKMRSKNKWRLTVLDANETEVGTVELSTDAARTYVNQDVLGNAGPKSPQAGTWAVTGPLPLGRLRDVHANRRADLLKQSQSEQRFKTFQSQHQSSNGGGSNEDHDKVFERLRALNEARAEQKKGEGNVAIKMTKITLINPLTLRIGGQDRSISHLYTQSGNEAEIRCYVGNRDGAYQRVHTSITSGDEKSSHTMVQTGEQVAIPGARDARNATRIGFNAQQGARAGFGGRTLTERDKGQSTVTSKSHVGDIQGQAHNELPADELAGSMLLAVRFNELLDLALQDVFIGEPQERQVEGITSDFKLLDEEWKSGTHHATPEHEFLEPLLGPIISTDANLNASVDAHPGVDKVLERFDLTYISGTNWLCFVRCLLAHFAQGPAALVGVHKRLRELGKPGLMGLDGVGVDTGSPAATDILAAVADVVGQPVSVQLIVPKAGQAPEIGAGSVGAGVQVFLLHTGAHFTLARPKQQ